MLGPKQEAQSALFYDFSIEDHALGDHVLRAIDGLGRLRLRGPCGAHDEFLLAATAQNLKKLAKLAPNPILARAAV